jgi:isopentenyl phosphate kinase
VQRAAHLLHRRGLSALDAEGLAPWSILPSSVPAAEEAETPGSAQPATLPVCVRALHHGLLPVTCGDIVLTADGSIAIWSTEEVLLRLTRDLHAAGQRVTRAIWLGITDGVYDDEGRTIRSLRPRDPTDVPSSVGGSAGTDVTGGMRLRVASAFEFARLGVESWILDGRRVGVLEAALRGERQGGTQVDAATRSDGDSHGT